MLHDEFHDSSIFWYCERVPQSATLYIIWLPVPAPISIRIIVTNAIVIDSTVTISIQTFLTDHFVFALFIDSYSDQFSWIHWVFDQVTIRRLSDHLCDAAITIQVIHWIFTKLTITIIVKYHHS